MNIEISDRVAEMFWLGIGVGAGATAAYFLIMGSLLGIALAWDKWQYRAQTGKNHD